MAASVKHHPPRLALTYLEVLLAAGIALTGILGAVAMLPVAVLNMQKGIVADTMSAVGPSALAQAEAMGALDPNNWMVHDYDYYSDTSTGVWNVPANHPTLGIRLPDVGLPLPTTDNVPWASVCIDARFAAEMAGAPAVVNPLPNSPAPHLFPYYKRISASPLDEARMLRVSLRRDQFSNVQMSVAQSRLLFKVSDDLLFDTPDDATRPALQNFINGGLPASPTTPVPQRRNYYANYEFIITRTPRIDGVPVYANGESYPGGTPTVPYTFNSLYTTSVVVFYKRETKLNGYPASTVKHPGAERLVSVTFPPGVLNSINGGDVEIQGSEADVALHEGDVVMLSRNRYAADGTFLGPLFQWYRVVSMSTSYFNGTNYSRDVSLQGGDWPVVDFPLPPGVPPPLTQMTILTGAVGVFETVGP